MKKKYITPAIEAMVMDECLPIADSLQISSTTFDDGEGDAKSEVEWDIWADD